MPSSVRSVSASEHPAVAVLLPGTGYTAQAPLLYWCAEILAQQGWHVQSVDWRIDDSALRDPQLFVAREVADAFDAAPRATRRLVVAKSFGSYALPWARRNDVPGIWLTPVLTDEVVRQALASAADSDLAIGGASDAMWLPDAVAGTGANVITVAGADHSLTVPGDWQGSLSAQNDVFAAIAAHLAEK